MESYNGNNSELNFLCLDLSLDRTGWSRFKAGELYDYGTINCNGKDFRHIDRLLCIVAYIRDLLAEFPMDCVILEDVHYGASVSTFKSLCELRGLVLAESYEFIGHDIFIFPTSHPRSCFEFNGQKVKSKEEAFDYVASLYKKENFNFKDHNDICDSILLGLSFKEQTKHISDKKMDVKQKLIKETMSEYLFREHWINDRSIKELAKEFKVSFNIILIWFNKLKLPTRS